MSSISRSTRRRRGRRPSSAVAHIESRPGSSPRSPAPSGRRSRHARQPLSAIAWRARLWASSRSAPAHDTRPGRAHDMRAMRLLDRIAVANTRIDPVDRRAVVEGGRRDRRRFPERGDAAAFPAVALAPRRRGRRRGPGQPATSPAITSARPAFHSATSRHSGRRARRRRRGASSAAPGLRHVAGIEGVDGEGLRDRRAGVQHVEIVVETGELDQSARSIACRSASGSSLASRRSPRSIASAEIASAGRPSSR